MPVLIFGNIDHFKAQTFKMEGARAVVAQNQIATLFALVANFSVHFKLAAFEAFRNHALTSSLDVAARVLRLAWPL